MLITEEADRQAEELHIKKALRQNQYPSWLFKDRTTVSLPPDPSETNVKGVGIPYIKGISEQLSRVFKQHGSKVYHQPRNTLRSKLVHVKDKTKEGQRSGVVYQVNCGECDATYIGETARPLATREKEHHTRGDSAVYCHHQTTDHSFGEASVLSMEQNYTKRQVKEAIFIKKYKPGLNRNQGYELPPIYDSVLNVPINIVE